MMFFGPSPLDRNNFKGQFHTSFVAVHSTHVFTTPFITLPYKFIKKNAEGYAAIDKKYKSLLGLQTFVCLVITD